MKFIIKNGLPMMSLPLTFNQKSVVLKHVLLDTACAVTVFDVDKMNPLNLIHDHTKGRAVRMFGVGGQSEWCYQQTIFGLTVNGRYFAQFHLQFGDIVGKYGFDGILGNDFFRASQSLLDFQRLEIIER